MRIHQDSKYKNRSVCVLFQSNVPIKQETKKKQKRTNAPSSWRGVCFNTFEEVFDISPEIKWYYIFISQQKSVHI